MNDHRRFADEGEVITTFHEIRSALSRIEDQTSKTNGRVRSLEMWKAYITGAIAVLGALAGLAIMLLAGRIGL